MLGIAGRTTSTIELGTAVVPTWTRHPEVMAAGALTAQAASGGRLVLTSRNWELVRSAGSRVDVRDRLIRRNDRDAVVSYYWQIEQRWEQEHFLEIVVAQIEPDGAVRACSERLSIWPYRYEDLVAQLRSVGLMVQPTTFDPESDGIPGGRQSRPGARHVRAGELIRFSSLSLPPCRLATVPEDQQYALELALDLP